mmetsp:Transcript_25514/g.30041  ORF Transcript_25514/g.30041 Transcript_25514/m.30041 type:complete len:118 (+) Transcript_25514:113-466(+)|eukprot:CAMPEP_0198264588 /NCGR_PEP_ID=MMETSP1447-20131203/16241_1 /TAXON_ID=420782 /ORGANISM="Chaetoceros dichaeta, Strain CCMP1751" /LENGTH=117 /DNA_ID=CAMNT_0043953575 /DNA_START=113 /DNA_END=466 /DNA_ORIENTATION=-
MTTMMRLLTSSSIRKASTPTLRFFTPSTTRGAAAAGAESTPAAKAVVPPPPAPAVVPPPTAKTGAGLFQRLSSFLVGAGLSALVSQYYIYQELQDGNSKILKKQRDIEGRLYQLEKK